MRMRDLAIAASLPRTTIHHYLREGLLPEPDRTAANAATYGPEHLDRLLLLKALRGPELGPLSVSEIRQVLPWIDPPVYARLSGGASYLAELRPATSLFLKFSGIDYDGDDAAGPDDPPARRRQLPRPEVVASIAGRLSGNCSIFLWRIGILSSLMSPNTGLSSPTTTAWRWTSPAARTA